MEEKEKTTSSIQIEERKRKKEKRELFLISAVSVAVFLGIWELAVRMEWLDPQFVCSPSEAFRAFVDKLTNADPDGAVLGVHILESLKLALIGYVAAVIVGVPLGLLLGYYRTFDRLVTPIFEIIRPIPPIAWIPLSVIWLGIGTTAKCFIIFLAAFVPCVINSYTGVKLTNPVLIDVAKTCGASRWTIFRTVCTPSAMPLAFTGVRVALGNAADRRIQYIPLHCLFKHLVEYISIHCQKDHRQPIEQHMEAEPFPFIAEKEQDPPQHNCIGA